MKKSGLYIILMMPILLSANMLSAAQISDKDVEAAEQKSALKQIEYKRLQAESVALSLELAKMNKELISAASKVQSDEDQITKTEAELELLQKKLNVTEEDFKKEYQNLGQVLMSIQNLALHQNDALIFQPLSPVEIVQSAILMRDTVPYLKDNAEKLKKDLENLNAQRNAVEKKLIELSTQTQSLKKKQSDIKKLAEEKNKLKNELEGQTEKTKKEALKLASEASDLRDLMEKAIHEAELKRRKQEELKRAAKERENEAMRRLEEEQIKRLKEGRGSGFEGAEEIQYDEDQNQKDNIRYDTITSKEQTKPNIKISGASGQFIRPARGEITTSYGQELSKGVNSKGVVIKTRANAQVVAPYDGTVVFSGPFKGYGNLIIISHSSDIVSLVAGMNEVEAENGQMVLAGEPIGLMPDSDNSKLYMEIRKNTKPVNPLPWLGQ